MYKSEGTVFKINKGNQNMKKKNHTADENFSLYRKQFSLIFLVIIKKNHINRRKRIDQLEHIISINQSCHIETSNLTDNKT